MANENAARVRRYVDAWNRRDAAGLANELDPEIEYVNAPDAVEPGVRRGRDAVVGVARAQWEMLGDAVSELDRLEDRGEEILTVLRVSRGMPGSDARIDAPTLLSWTFRDGRLLRIEVLAAGTSFAEAATAAGLSSDAG